MAVERFHHEKLQEGGHLPRANYGAPRQRVYQNRQPARSHFPVQAKKAGAAEGRIEKKLPTPIYFLRSPKMGT